MGQSGSLTYTIKMFRVALRTSSAIKQCLKIQAPATSLVRHSSAKKELDARYVAYFSRPDIDGWECRKAMNDLCGEDMIPEPKIVIAAMHACRKLNDIALAIRYLEAVKWKCGEKEKVIWPYMIQEITPTLKELGIPTPEEIGYDKPELALRRYEDMVEETYSKQQNCYKTS